MKKKLFLVICLSFFCLGLFSFRQNFSVTYAENYPNEIEFVFDVNGGTYENLSASNYYIDEQGNYVITYLYNHSPLPQYNFNTQGTLIKSHSEFNGWFGKLKLNETTYYFDTQMLENFSNANYNLSRIAEYFTTDISNLNSDFSITGFSSTITSQPFKYLYHTTLFLDNNMRPTFIAKWDDEEFTISFETKIDKKLPSLTLNYGEQIPEFESLSKTGYSFGGWYENESLTLAFSKTTMPGYNLTLFAKWNINSYNINFETNGGSNIESERFEYNSQISNLPQPTKTGYSFLGWYEDENLTTELSLETMPAYDITLYAKWEIQTFSIYVSPLLNNSINGAYHINDIEYGSIMSKIDYIERTGYTFVGWYTDRACTKELKFDIVVTSDIYLYALYSQNTYEILLETYTDSEKITITGVYNATLSLPNNLTKSGYMFSGWYLDENFENEFTSTKMPSENITLYAKWTPKQTLNIKISPQSYTFGDNFAVFTNTSGVDKIKIYYLVDGKWTMDVPTAIGAYDIRITRNEDDTYASVDLILQKGFSIVEPQMNVGWIIAFLYLATLIEIVASIFVRMLRKKKMSATFVVIGTSFISTSQFVHLIFSGVLCLAGFVYLVYQIVQVSRTVNNENFSPSREDNRARFKDQLTFQNDQKNAELDFETKTKTSESFGEKYSNADIERMLKKDDYADKIRSQRPENKNEENENLDDEYQLNANADLFDENQEDNFDLDKNQENIMPQSHYDIIQNIETNNLDDSFDKNDDLNNNLNETSDNNSDETSDEE